MHGLSKERGDEDQLLAALAFGVSRLQHAGGAQDSPAHLQDSASLVGCPAARKGELLRSVPDPFSQFAGRLECSPLWLCMLVFPPALPALFPPLLFLCSHPNFDLGGLLQI